jgi:hypothetical protein
VFMEASETRSHDKILGGVTLVVSK